MNRILPFVLLSLFALPALAEEVPTAAEIKKVMDYFRTGQGKGPVLVDLVPCLKVDRPAPGKKKDCVEPAGEKVKKGTVVNAFTRWFVPQDDTYELTFEWLHEGKVVSTGTASVEGSFGYGTWKAKTLSRPGTWEVRIKRGDEVLGSTKIVAEE